MCVYKQTNKPKVLEDYKSSPPPTSNLVNKLFPTTKPKPTSNAALMKEHVITPPIAPVDGALNQLLMEKKKELEREVVRFREENASLAALHKERADVSSAIVASYQTHGFFITITFCAYFAALDCL